MLDTAFQSFTELSNRAQGAPRLAALRAQLKARKLQGFIIPRSDEHQGEYVPPSEERLAWLTGFTGSAGTAIVLMHKAAVFVDGRYTVQVREQVDTRAFAPVSSIETAPDVWLKASMKPGAAIGYDPRLHTPDDAARLAAAAEERGGTLVAVDINPVDVIWTDRPPVPVAPVSMHPEALAGERAEDKLRRVRAALSEENLDALLITDPHALAWAFNFRGGDVSHTPLPRGFGLVPREGRAQVFLDGRKLSNSVRAALHDLADVAEPGTLPASLEALGATKARVRLDAASASQTFKTQLEAAGATVSVGRDPIALMKAAKNAAEIAGARAAHLRDGAAMVRFLEWFDREAPKGTLTEIDAVVALERFRVETGSLKNISFPSIAGAGPNAALPHYKVSETSNRRIEPGIFLIDSGGQYEDGTTDITRTLCVGTPTRQMQDRFTRVLKGMIAISRAVFPKGVSGAQLDSFARSALWEAGLDFDHGTGHGVGSYLSVHEGPQRIAKTGTTPLQPGMILSNEPGYYKAGHFGIRIENLIVVEPRKIRGSEREMYGFETITLAPIDRRLILRRLLTREERAWLNAYHARVLREVGPLCDAATQRWLEAACAAV